MDLDKALEKDLAGVQAELFAPIYEAAAKKYGLDPSLLRSIAMVESGQNPRAVSPKGAQGLMQLIPSTAAALGVKDPFDPEQSIFGAAKLLRENLDRYDGDLVQALSAYHGGTDTRNWGPLTKAYPDKVLSYYAPAEDSALGNYSLEDSLLADLDELKTLPTLEAEAIPESMVPSPSADLWGMGQNFIHTSLLGAGIPVEAAGAAARQVVESLRNGIGWKDAITRVFPQRYKEVFEALEGARAKWEKEAPGAALGTELAGTIPAIMAVIGTGGRAAMLTNARLAKTLPKTAEALGKVGRFLGGTAGEGSGAGNFLLRQGSRAISGAGQGALSGALTSEVLDEDPWKAATFGAMVGGPLNVATRPVLNVANSLIKAKIAPAVGEMAEEADKLGVRLRGGQLTESGWLRQMDNALVGGDPEQLAAFTRAVSRTFGEDTPQITKDVMDRAATRLGKKLDDIAAKTTIKSDQILYDELDQIRKNALAELPAESPELKKLLKQLDQVDTEVLMGQISGDTYQALTRFDSSLGRMIRDRDGTLRHYGRQIRRTLDDALERNAPADLVEDLRATRRQWKNMETVEDLVETAQPSGVLDPMALKNAVTKSYKDYAYTGAGDIGTLAEAGRFLPRVDPSGAPLTKSSAPFTTALTGGVLGELGNAYMQLAPPGTAAGLSALGYLGTKALGLGLQTKLYRDLLIRNGQIPPLLEQNALIPAGTQLYLED